MGEVANKHLYSYYEMVFVLVSSILQFELTLLSSYLKLSRVTQGGRNKQDF
jgi:hypothetical protein